MRYIRAFGDERILAFCTFCGAKTSTRDHCPSRVLLDKPYPDHLPRVPACRKCNQSFSLHEEYFACLISCVRAGSTDAAKITRPKIRRILQKKPRLAARLKKNCVHIRDQIAFRTEDDRVRKVVIKLARGHVLHELHELCLHPPRSVVIKPFQSMSAEERDVFESTTRGPLLPEMGSRAMQRRVLVGESGATDWLAVQSGNYRYLADSSALITVRIAVQEYLACYVAWSTADL